MRWRNPWRRSWTRGEELRSGCADAGVCHELEDRACAAGARYPYAVGEQAIQLDSDLLDAGSTYVFLLLLSKFGVNAAKGVRVRPERDFEDISLVAAEGYFGRNEHDGSYLFAFPRRTGASGFPAAVNELSEQLGEGGGASRVKPAAQQKDAHLDVVVWHGFPDRRPGQLIAFGQCAAGANWTTKLSELPDTRTWCQAWMLQPPSVPAVRMFFVPHRPTQDEWRTRATLGGVLFDRCRIAHHVPQLPSQVRSRCIRWLEAVRIAAGGADEEQFHGVVPLLRNVPRRICREMVNELTGPNDLVADPFCGRGTTPFQALLMDRNALGSDINPVAYCFDESKDAGSRCAHRAPSPSQNSEVSTKSESGDHWCANYRNSSNVGTTRQHGGQILYLRSCSGIGERGRVDAMVAALVLGALHGESEKSSSYLSAQMPRTILDEARVFGSVLGQAQLLCS